MSDYSIIQIHTNAPTKPAMGSPCNGCGVCCAAAPCPVSALFLKHKEGKCPALLWDEQQINYRCGMVLMPSRYCSWMPVRLDRIMTLFIRRWIALNVGCDYDAEVKSQSID